MDDNDGVFDAVRWKTALDVLHDIVRIMFPKQAYRRGYQTKDALGLGMAVGDQLFGPVEPEYDLAVCYEWRATVCGGTDVVFAQVPFPLM